MARGVWSEQISDAHQIRECESVSRMVMRVVHRESFCSGGSIEVPISRHQREWGKTVALSFGLQIKSGCELYGVIAPEHTVLGKGHRCFDMSRREFK